MILKRKKTEIETAELIGDRMESSERERKGKKTERKRICRFDSRVYFFLFSEFITILTYL